MPPTTAAPGTCADWVVLAFLVAGLVVIDLAQGRSPRRSAWVALGLTLTAGLGLGVALWLRYGAEPAGRYATGTLLEWGLSVDNLLVFVLVLDHFRIPQPQRRRVLFWGILGAVVLRTLLIAVGVQAVVRFHWVSLALGALVLLSAAKMAFTGGSSHSPDPAGSPPLRTVLALLPLAPEPDGDRFLTRRRGRLLGTPLLAALLTVEAADLVFAMDSIPAVVGFTRDTYLAAASNALALVGLRSLFFVVTGALARMRHLRAGLAALLAFAGLRMLAEPWVRMPTPTALGVMAGILALTAGLGLIRPAPKAG